MCLPWRTSRLCGLHRDALNHRLPGVSQDLRLHLIRHGETEWSLSGRHTGRTDVALTTHGEAQARALSALLAATRFNHVFTSPALRARETFALSGALSGASLPAAEIEPDLAEWDYGVYEGKTSSEIHQDRPDWNCYRDGCPGGESPGDVSDRADRLLARLCCLSGNIALFSHGEFGSSLVVRWIGLPVALGEHFQLGTASVSILQYNQNHPGLRVISQLGARP